MAAEQSRATHMKHRILIKTTLLPAKQIHVMTIFTCFRTHRYRTYSPIALHVYSVSDSQKRSEISLVAFSTCFHVYFSSIRLFLFSFSILYHIAPSLRPHQKLTKKINKLNSLLCEAKWTERNHHRATELNPFSFSYCTFGADWGALRYQRRVGEL